MEPAVLGKSVGVAVQPVPPRRPRWSFTGEGVQGLTRSVQADSIIGLQPLHGAYRNLWGGLALDPLLQFVREQAPHTDLFCFQEAIAAPAVSEIVGSAQRNGWLTSEGEPEPTSMNPASGDTARRNEG
jgi:hypothetical protein